MRYLPVGLLVAVVMLVEMLTLIGVRARTVRASSVAGRAESRRRSAGSILSA